MLNKKSVQETVSKGLDVSDAVNTESAEEPETISLTEARQDESSNGASDEDYLSLKELREDSTFDSIPMRTILTTAAWGRWANEDFVRVRPGPEYRLVQPLLKLKNERQLWWVDRKIRAHLKDFLHLYELFCYVTLDGASGICPVRVPIPGERTDMWTESLRRGVGIAETRWVQIMSDMAEKKYKVKDPIYPLPDEPKFFEESFEKFLNIVLRPYIIKDLDHPICRKILGLTSSARVQ